MDAVLKEKLPGPGSYVLPPKAFGKSRFAMGTKYKDLNQSKELLPGPGDYSLVEVTKVKQKTPAFSMGGRYKE